MVEEIKQPQIPQAPSVITLLMAIDLKPFVYYQCTTSQRRRTEVHAFVVQALEGKYGKESRAAKLAKVSKAPPVIIP